MPLFCPPAPPVEVRPAYEFEESAYAQGEAASTIRKNFVVALGHWADRSSFEEESADEANLATTRHVPLKIVGKIKVHYRSTRSLMPRRILFDTDEE